MGIGERISHLQLKHKLLLPNILYLILFIAVLFFFIKSNEMIKGIARDQQASFTLSEKINTSNSSGYQEIHQQGNLLS